MAVLHDVIDGKSDLLGRLTVKPSALPCQLLGFLILSWHKCFSGSTGTFSVIQHVNVCAGALVTEVTKDAVEAALHKQGTYALQKVLESPCRDAEFVQLGQSLMEKALQLVSGEPGIYVMAKLVDRLVSLVFNLPSGAFFCSYAGCCQFHFWV